MHKLTAFLQSCIIVPYETMLRNREVNIWAVCFRAQLLLRSVIGFQFFFLYVIYVRVDLAMGFAWEMDTVICFLFFPFVNYISFDCKLCSLASIWHPLQSDSIFPEFLSVCLYSIGCRYVQHYQEKEKLEHRF